MMIFYKSFEPFYYYIYQNIYYIVRSIFGNSDRK